MRILLKKSFIMSVVAMVPVLGNTAGYQGQTYSAPIAYQQYTQQPGYAAQTNLQASPQSNPQYTPYGYPQQVAPQQPVTNANSNFNPSIIQGGVVTVINRQLGARVVIGGTVVPYREVTLTAQIPGRVQFIAGEEGESFDINQVLVAIDDDDLLAKRRQAVAQYQGAGSSYRDARVQYSREFWSPQIQQRFAQQPAGGGGVFPMMFERFFGGGGGQSNPWAWGNPWIERQADLYSRGSNVSRVNSQMTALRSQIDEVDAKLLDSRSIAPFSGVILQKLVEIGDTVQPGKPLLRYADNSDLQIQLDVPARLMPGIRKDMILPANLDVGDLRVNARISQIFPMADPQRHTVTVKLDLPQGVPGGPGMYAEVEIPDISVPVSNVPVIPFSAVVWRGSLPAVFVLNAQNKSELRLVRLGEQMDDQTIAVLSGIRQGDRVFASPPPGMNSNWKPRNPQTIN